MGYDIQLNLPYMFGFEKRNTVKASFASNLLLANLPKGFVGFVTLAKDGCLAVFGVGQKRSRPHHDCVEIIRLREKPRQTLLVTNLFRQPGGKGCHDS